MAPGSAEDARAPFSLSLRRDNLRTLMTPKPTRFTSFRARTITGALLLAACAPRDDKQPTTRQAGSPAPTPAVAARRAGDLEVMLPVTEHTPVGIRVANVTVWLDSTPIGPAASALGVKLPLGHYAPYQSLRAACVRTATQPRAYVFLKAKMYDSAAVTEVVFTSGDPREETDPDAPCIGLRDSSAKLSTSLGLALGMSPAEVTRLLGTPDEADSNPKFKTRYLEYHLGKIADDTSNAGEERALHANVDLNTMFVEEKLIMIRIQRGPRARYYE